MLSYLQTCNKENMSTVNGKFTQHRQRTEPNNATDDVTAEPSEDGPTRYGRVVLPDRRAVANVGGRPRNNVMKRKTLRRCDDGQISVSESFTESEAVDDGSHFFFFLSHLHV